MRVTYHAACSLQHGQKVTEAPKRLLANAGFTVRTAAESHLCCGSAGVYNVLQPELSGQLKQRKEKMSIPKPITTQPSVNVQSSKKVEDQMMDSMIGNYKKKNPFI